MKHLSKSCKLVALIAFGAVLLLSQLEAAAQNATDYIPGVQLSPSQSAQIAVSNVSAAASTATINVMNADGSIFMTKTATVQPGKTFVFAFTNGNATALYSATVTSSLANSLVSDFQTFASNRTLTAGTLPQQNRDHVQNTPSLRAVPGQSAAATVTNIAAVTTQFSVIVLDLNGNVVVSQSSVLNPGQTLSYPFSNTGTVNNGYRVVVSVDLPNTIVSDLLLFSKVTGQVAAILQPSPIPD